ncbi:MAG TPA: DUF4837 family protein [Candidatus Parabacteroides intestinigallinarum]|uniref:DUF4837 family protein n=1 Tax=Candidatus Parabacteroides intestinigallinarum TaxID=2838722 RepID=A0A9D1XS92_9BACT|nr:DUF4837 family protein [Candidatus Parabacteroides intestinigallinarum]
MRIASLCVSLLSLFIGMGACSSGPALSRATGFAYEVVVVMDQEVWNGPAGEAVKSELASDVPGLPQYEPSLKITYVPPKDFSGLFEYVRNILVVTIDSTRYTKVSLGYENDVWARGQVVLTMRAPNAKSIVEFSETNKNALVDFFVKEEIDRAVGQLKEEYSSVVMENLKSNLDVELNAPANFIYYKDTTDFFWSSNNATTGRMDLVVYTFPYTDPDTFTADYLVAKRDSVMKANLPGGHPGSYMQTEKRAGVEYEPITLQDKYCGLMRGLWRMEGDMMGGPFVSVARLDERNNRVVVAEGFVYAPETNKRNYIRRMEASMYTLRLPGEFGQPESEK